MKEVPANQVPTKIMTISNLIKKEFQKDQRSLPFSRILATWIRTLEKYLSTSKNKETIVLLGLKDTTQIMSYTVMAKTKYL